LKPVKPADQCWFANQYGRCTAEVEQARGARAVFCREHRRCNSNLINRLVVLAAPLEDSSLWRRLVWATARMQQLLELRLRDQAAAVAEQLLRTPEGRPVAGDEARALVVVLKELALAIGPKHPLVERWRDAWHRVGPPISSGQIEPSSAPLHPGGDDAAQAPPAARGGGKAP